MLKALELSISFIKILTSGLRKNIKTTPPTTVMVKVINIESHKLFLALKI